MRSLLSVVQQLKNGCCSCISNSSPREQFKSNIKYACLRIGYIINDYFMLLGGCQANDNSETRVYCAQPWQIEHMQLATAAHYKTFSCREGVKIEFSVLCLPKNILEEYSLDAHNTYIWEGQSCGFVVHLLYTLATTFIATYNTWVNYYTYNKYTHELAIILCMVWSAPNEQN